ncbi:MAG: RNA polymerase sigma factor [Clostridiales bacterium]|nr:RNA polymerase sigma factor [Clostridiales bacterium]
MEQNQIDMLVKKAKNMDPEAFAQLYKEIYMDLYRFAYYTLRNTHDAEDVVSETVVDAYYGITKLKEEKAFKGWIFKILSAKCKRKLKDYTNKTFPLDLEADIPGLEKENYDDLNSALLSLSDKERMILSMSIYAGYKSAEIGKTLHMNHNTVRSVQSRALDKLRAILEV